MLVESSPVVLAHAPDAGGAILGRPRKQHGKRTLATILRERGVLSTAHAVEVVLEICDALAIAHANGVVHGQLGLACVRLAFTPDAGPRDVEIFTLVADADESGAIHAAPFVEPDHADGTRRIADARSDVWALGALLYTMLVGLPPAPSERARAVEIPAESMPRSLGAVVEACLANDPELRPATVDDLAEKIASFATWPPDQFARLAERRDRRAAAERVRQQLERRGLGNMPNVLDKLDDAALARAQRTDTAEISSVLHGKTTEAALERLMTAVHEGTDAARVELAAALPALVDFDDEDEEVLPTVVNEEPSSLTPVPCPLATAPVVLPEIVLPAPPELMLPEPPPAPAAAASPRANAARFALAGVAIVLVAGCAGYLMSATASARRTAASVPSAASAAPAPLPVVRAAEPAPPAIPVFVPSALPEAPITPASLPEAKR